MFLEHSQVVLDERGREMTSEELADLIAEAGDNSAASVVFAIGGPFGHPPEVADVP
jgi:23S rRNA (pseudouridine1915-N3)-methyltransferase